MRDMLKKASNLCTHLLLYAWHLLLPQSFKTFSMTPIQLYIHTLETKLLIMPNDGYVKETLKACLDLAKGIKEIYENPNNNVSQPTNQD
jgi:hypothetical protein